MQTGRVGALAAVALSLACAKPAFAPKLELHTKHYRLPNGLEVVLQEDHHAPRIAVRVSYHVGAKDDPPGKSGLAHLVEHVTFAATRHIATDETLDTLAELGGRDVNGETSVEQTAYHEVLPSTELEAALWIASEQMAYVDPTPAIVEREKSILDEEREQSKDDRAYGNVYGLTFTAVFPKGHPYRECFANKPDHAALTLDDVVDFRRAYYSPDNATLVIVGDFDTAAVTTSIERWFGAIVPHGHSPSRTAQPVTRAASSSMLVQADVAHREFVLAWPLPAVTSDGFLEAVMGLEVLFDAMNGYFVAQTRQAGRLRWRLWTARAASLGSITFEDADHMTDEDVLRGVAYLRDALVKADLDRRVDRVTTRTLEVNLFSYELLDARSAMLAEDTVQTGDPDATIAVLNKLDRMVSADVADALVAFLDPANAALVTVMPARGVPRGGRELP